METSRLLAVDPSVTCSGWALFECRKDVLLAAGKLRALPPSQPFALRVKDLQDRIAQLLGKLELTSSDIVVCEAPTTMRDPHASIKVEQVRGLFESMARARGVLVPGRINPRSVHREIMGLKGKQLPRTQIKDIALTIVSTIYGSALADIGLSADRSLLKRHQDIVDAILLGSLALTWRKAALMVGKPLENYFDDRKQTRSTRGGFKIARTSYA